MEEAFVTECAWKLSGNQKPIEQKIVPFSVSFKHAMHHLPLALNFLYDYYLKEKLWNKRVCTFDPFKYDMIITDPNWKGCPLGGIGSGVIIRSPNGDFCRWSLSRAAVYSNRAIGFDQFSLRISRPNQSPQAMVLNDKQKVLLRKSNQWELQNSKSTKNVLQSNWKFWNQEQDHKNPPLFQKMKQNYSAIFPTSWYDYELPEAKCHVVCRQFSPVIPHNYKESSYPISCFEYSITNQDPQQEMTVSLMFSFQNGGYIENSYNHFESKENYCNQLYKTDSFVGVNMVSNYQTRMRNGIVETDTLQLCLSTMQSEGIEISYRIGVELNKISNLNQLWNQFETNGTISLSNEESKISTTPENRLGSAICVTITIPPNTTKQIPFFLTWSNPIYRLGLHSHYRKYTAFFSMEKEEPISIQVAKEAILQYQHWYSQIQAFRNPILKDATLPNWFKGLLFNETYYIVDGGTIWTNGILSDDEQLKQNHASHFGYMEGQEYIMVNTYDVHFYASYALIQLWPELQLSIQRDFAKTVFQEWNQLTLFHGTGKKDLRKARGCIPHDLGTVEEDPWILVNAYQAQNVNRWKDLNPMFVLSCFRDYQVTKNEQFLREIYPAVVKVLEYHKQFDKDQDGVIENESFPDSTYDSWVVTGVSAFTSGLYIHALRCAAEMATILQQETDAKHFTQEWQKGLPNYEQKLWNGKYYNYDSSQSQNATSIQSDMLHGHWYMKLCNLPPLLQQERITSSLATIYQSNCVAFAKENKGKVGGIVNGMKKDGKMDQSSLQSKEVWTGVAYITAALFLTEGMEKECWEGIHSMYETVWQPNGLCYWFQTPEAYDEYKTYRSLAYMRPLSIWAVKLANDLKKKQHM